MKNALPYKKITTAVLIAWSGIAAADESAAPSASSPIAAVALLTQAKGLPAEFLDHFFDTPLVVRVEVDRQFLGEATIVLSRDETVELIGFTDVSESALAPVEQQRWAGVLQKPRKLGSCESQCPFDLLGLDYSLENSMLSIVTTAAERIHSNAQFHALPEGGSHGVILRNSLRAAGGGDQDWSGSYTLEAQGSVGNWTTVGNLQLDQSANNDANPRHSIQRLFAQREMDGLFLRGGLFDPNDLGLVRAPRTAGGRAYTTAGVMVGSSHTLAVDSAVPSVYPVYVTPAREGMVEIYRNGVLINSQPVQPGLQVIDTRRLPGGIYEVEVRVIEDSQVISRSTELIYKPSHWRNPEERWRYTAFAGMQRSLWDSESNPQSGDFATGVAANYLLHPRAVVGLSTQVIGSQTQFGSSIDWEAGNNARLYANMYHSSGYGNGVDAQAIIRYKQGSATLSHNRSWLDNLSDREEDLNGIRRYRGITQSTALSLYHRMGQPTDGSLRFSYSRGATDGLGVDISLNHRRQVFGHDSTLRISAFDRPTSQFIESPRNRGIEFTLNMALGKEGTRILGSAGSRRGVNGGSDQYASLTYQQSFEQSLLRHASGTATADRYGLGLSGSADFMSRAVSGDTYLQRSSFNGDVSGGVNLESTVAIGANRVAATGEKQIADAGLIIDVDSDMPDIALHMEDSGGSGAMLKPGRNFVPVNPYKNGLVLFDFSGADAPAAVIQPTSSSYHLNKGGVDYRQIRVMQTVLVMGRLVDKEGNAIKGAHLVNHAGRSVTEADGFFAVEMSESSPTLEIRHSSLAGACEFIFDQQRHRREEGALLVGDVTCPTSVVKIPDAVSDRQS